MPTKVRDPLNVKIGDAIKAARERRGIPARAIAEAIGTTVGAVGNWESGQNAIAAGNFFKVADFLEVDARALSRGELVFLDDPGAQEIDQAHSQRPDITIIRLWELVGTTIRAKPEYRTGVITAIEEFMATQPISRAISSKQRS